MVLNKYVVAGGLLIATLLLGQTAAAPPEKIKILVSIRPLALLVQDLVGDLAQVDVLLSANMDPHNATLRFSERKKIADSEILVWLGPQLEGFLDKAAANLPGAQQIRLDQIETLDWREARNESEHDTHQHHYPLGKDPHVWLSVGNAQLILARVADMVGQLRPEMHSALQQRQAQLSQSLLQLDRQIAASLTPLKNNSFGVYHDAYGHFVNHYSLNQLAAVNQMPEESLGARQMVELIQNLQGAKCLLVERHGHSAERLAERLGIPVVLADPLASNSALQTYEQFMWSIAQAFRECLSGVNH